MSAGPSKKQINYHIRKLKKKGLVNIRVLRASNGEVCIMGDEPKKKESFKEAGYEYIKSLGNGHHLLENVKGKLEIWVANKGHASYGLKYKNTHLEFVRTQRYQSYCGITGCELCAK